MYLQFCIVVSFVVSYHHPPTARSAPFLRTKFFLFLLICVFVEEPGKTKEKVQNTSESGNVQREN